jgi:hypothetical protein
LNVTVIVQCAAAVRGEGLMGQLLLAPKSPLAVIDPMVNPAVPLLVSVENFSPRSSYSAVDRQR